MPRHDPWEDASIRSAQPINPVHAQARVDDATLCARRHAARRRRMIHRLAARAHERLDVRVAAQVARVVEVGSQEGRVEVRCKGLGARDAQAELDAADELGEIFGGGDVTANNKNE